MSPKANNATAWNGMGITYYSSRKFNREIIMEKRIDVYFMRHGRTSDNDKGVVSGGDANPNLIKDGIEQATETNKIDLFIN